MSQMRKSNVRIPKQPEEEICENGCKQNNVLGL